jgi:hypothetical protein
MEQRVKISSLDTARLTCPECRRTKLLQLSEYKLMKRITRVRFTCSCGHVYFAALEKKSGLEKETHLAGTFVSRGSIRCAGKMVVKRLNSAGLTLRTNLEQRLPAGITLLLEFVLDDAKQSVVKKEVKILAKNGKYLTAEFIEKDHYDNLGPYLFFNKLYV